MSNTAITLSFFGLLVVAVFLIGLGQNWPFIKKEMKDTTSSAVPPVVALGSTMPVTENHPVEPTSPKRSNTEVAKPKRQVSAPKEYRAVTEAQPLVASSLPQAPEFRGLSGFINSDPSLSMAQLRGKVVMTFFWTYSCINCQRTINAVEALYEKYKDQGLVVVGVHTPEFASERVLTNVQDAVTEWHITFPVVLDNDYATWKAYGNNFWPNRYVIDKNGSIVFSHAGEGDHDAIEYAVQAALAK